MGLKCGRPPIPEVLSLSLSQNSVFKTKVPSSTASTGETKKTLYRHWKIEFYNFTSFLFKGRRLIKRESYKFWRFRPNVQIKPRRLLQYFCDAPTFVGGGCLSKSSSEKWCEKGLKNKFKTNKIRDDYCSIFVTRQLLSGGEGCLSKSSLKSDALSVWASTFFSRYTNK